MTAQDLWNELASADHDTGRQALRKSGFVYTAPTRIGTGYTEATAYGIIDDHYQQWAYRTGNWLLVNSWKAVPGRKYGRPEAQVGI